MSVLLYRSFVDECVKIAIDKSMLDADMRALIHERKGVEYLKGGKLKSNGPDDNEFVIQFPFGGGAVKAAAFSAATALKNAGQVGKMKNVVKRFSTPKPAGLLGQKFKITSY